MEDSTHLLEKLNCEEIFKTEDDFNKYCSKKYKKYPISFLDLKNCIFLFHLHLRDSKYIKVENCHFIGGLTLKGKVDEAFEATSCHFHEQLIAEEFIFQFKARFRICYFHGSTNFRNTKFLNLADFWNCEFVKPVIFYKTDFNDTVVFSSARFKKNVLFTYTLFAGRAIFGRTKFNAGFDLSQAIIKGDLKLFDLKFKFGKFSSEYVGENDEKFRECIEENHLIPQINKVATFQLLKIQFSKEGNHIDEIEMRKYEKVSFTELIKYRKADKSWKQNTLGDQFILNLNRISNQYKSDFISGVLFTLLSSIILFSLVLISSYAFWENICVGCELDKLTFGRGVKLYVNFLNPAHRITYIDKLKPFWGIPYVWDFLGRVVIGFGIYQTIQAFRKYK